MNLRPRFINIAAVLVVLAVIGYLLYAAMSNVRNIDVVVMPETLYPDGKSEAVVEVRLLNVFGSTSWSHRSAQFRIIEGEESGKIVGTSELSARVRATFAPGTIVMRVYIEGVPLPYEVQIPVRRSYALGDALS